MWETEDEGGAYRTPSRSSRRSSRQKSSSPPPNQGSKDITRDESDNSISILDPRRFTPTLHANLVSEILALRRDQEEKIKTIESLESALHNTLGEHEDVETSLGATAKENRSLKRQLALLEGGTSSALSELARERDDAVESNNDMKRRLETAQKKIKSQDDDSNRVHELWERDKDNWQDDKRKLEHKVHVAEGRLRAVLDEVAAYQANHQNAQQQTESEAEEISRDPVQSDTGSVRSMSMTNSIRFSMLNGPNGGTKLNGISLADELGLDDDEEVQADQDGRESSFSVRHNRTQSRESVFSKHHRRNQSNESLMRPGSVARGRLIGNQSVLERLEGGILEDDESVQPKAKVEYIDTGVQYSPPPSPELPASVAHSPVEHLAIKGTDDIAKEERQEPEHVPREWEIEANQRRKRVHASPLMIEASSEGRMVSAASQTQEPPSPPRTPISPTRAPPPPPPTEVVVTPEMISMSTQTDAPELQSPRRAAPPPPIPIPSIQLHPPTSAPTTPRENRLPQYFKDAGCQVTMQVPVPSRSISVQTEEIRVDKRLNLLPPHLQPSSISSNPPSPEPGKYPSTKSSTSEWPELGPRDSILTTGAPRGETHDAYPGNNDDGFLTKDRGLIRRPPRISSLFAGFENVSSDDADDFADADMSDNDYRTPLSAPNPQSGTNRASKHRALGPTSVPENLELSEVSKSTPGKSSMKRSNQYDEYGDYGSAEVPSDSQRASMKPLRQLDKPLTLVTNNKPNAMRRAALIQSGVAAHQGRSRSPSIPEVYKEPPFPIPTRASSRRPPVGASAPSDGNRSPTWGRGTGRGHYRANSIRKVRSATALPRGGRSYRRHGSRSPPPMSPSTEAPESPSLPPMPSNEITTPRYMRDTGSSRYRSHRQQPSVTTANTANTTNTSNTGSGSVGSTNQATSVVDAIAQTMVGEWMFKYVRRRKSFGVADANATEGDNVNGVRHKRWVWLAPYERAVMWSSKQPTSGSALMGKTGRKLVTIQSVLDVKDDNTPPKGSGPIFNRSILILTPARALKFTAVSAERHYVWLTALSFLAHSSQAVPEIVQAPLPAPQPVIPNFEVPQGGARLRRNGIRDSIRVAKGKTSTARSGPTSVHSSQYGGTDHSIREVDSIHSSRTDPIPMAADPPFVPRFSERGSHGPPLSHNRKRSNTGSRIPPPLSFRGFSSPTGTGGHAPTSSTAGMSVGTNGSSDIYQSQPASSVSAGYTGMSVSGRSSVRTSDASNRPVNNFFDAVGTMRMEAFISPMASRFDEFPKEQEQVNMMGMHHRRGSRERRRRSRNRDSYYSNRGRPSDDWHSGSKTAGEEEYGHFDSGLSHDPFRGF
ncbi:Anucleate primary sterigmata protein A [Lachnellula arida]|uniref:Anucleate primary sterigmata protein A n=1 Tax=Lachnellula arida TaxID=1316785 RepID=A0A8T9BNY7_9HELO|nr:Anucleate primary sterigmata protein A [Lachnellula arida]